jgi:hypothetical protein
LGYAAQKITGSTLNDVPSDVWTSALVGNNYGGMLVIRKQGIIKSGNK